MTPLDDSSCYLALTTHDRRFDGRFFIGVTSTGIYCRPICTVKIPQLKNCRFFSSAALAESQGFRPCLRCRPELAPGQSHFESSERIARYANRLIENGFLEDRDLTDLAAKLSVTDRHLRRVFKQEFGVSLIDYVQTQRLLTAKRLLTDTSMRMADVAFASGFASLRRFNTLFKERYRLTPSDLRKSRPASASSDYYEFDLSYRPPYEWPAMLEFLWARSISGVEEVTCGEYRRSVVLHRERNVDIGWVAVAHNERQHALRIRVASSLSRSIPIVLARLKRLFDLACHPTQVDAVLGGKIPYKSGLRVPGSFDGFETATRAILGQQISVKAATTLAGRMAIKFGGTLEVPFGSVTHTFPEAVAVSQVSVNDLTSIGLTGSRATSILALASAIASGRLQLDGAESVTDTMRVLTELPGIGEWTAQYIAMRVMSWPDAFPHSDLGIKKALGISNPKQILEVAEAWRPWRAYAAINLWHSLGNSLKESST